MNIIGIMSGSSLDGIDMACVHFNDIGGIQYEITATQTFALPDELRQKLRHIVDMNAFELSKVESSYTQFIADLVIRFCKNYKLECTVLGVHGHTVLHLPDIQSSWQLLNAGMLSSLTEKSVVSDFRNQDMALGGQGTPMAALIDRDFFSDYAAVINLGGIANVSIFQDGTQEAYDICPCNQVHDVLAGKMQLPFDKDGLLGANGHVDEELLDKLIQHDYLKIPPPKSLDNTWIREEWLPILESTSISVNDALRTHYECVAICLRNALSDLKGKILLTGGGAKNKFLIDLLKQITQRDDIEIELPENRLIDFKESFLMAYMAFKRIKMQSNFIKECTGASKDVIAGALYIYAPSDF